jgi:hypothetical protein|tara:strand:+ start:221 stop:1222 length:1002 start_codon:yes stop_codon:yes gene_type:complete
MKALQLEKSLRTLIALNQPCFVWGGVGVGKSEIVHKVSSELGYTVRDIRVALLDPVDLRGVPSVEDGITVWNPPVFLPTENDGKVLLFLDELPQGSPSVQNALFQLVKDRQLGEYTLPKDTVIVSAGNRVQDKAGANRVNTALGDRFIHLNLESCPDEWIEWGAKSGRIRQEVLSFIGYQGEDYLYHFDKNSPVNATPRAWEYASKILDTDPDKDIEQELYAGTIGEGISAEFTSFVRRYRQLPSIDKLLKNPENIFDDVEYQSDTIYLIIGVLAKNMTKDNIQKFYDFMKNTSEIQDEFLVLAMTMATARDEGLKKTKAYIDYEVDYQDIGA